LVVWQKATGLASEILDIAEQPPFAKRFYFRDQICDAAMSVAANIAEGNGRSTPLDYASFLDRSRGSLFELDSWMFMAARRRMISPETHAHLEGQIQEISAMLLAMANRLRSSPRLPSRRALEN
jgi:four helix bundle protein